MASSPENPNQLPPPEGSQQAIQPTKPASAQPAAGFARTIEQPPATVSVKAGTGVVSDIGDNNITERAEQIRYATDEAMIWQEAPSMALLVPRAVKYLIFMAVIFLLCAVANRVVGGNPATRSALEQNGVRVTSSNTARRAAHKKRHAATTADDTTATSPDASSTDGTPAAAPADEEPPAQGWTFARILFLVKLAFGILYAVLFLLYLLRLKSTRYQASSQRLIVEEGTWHVVNKPYELHQLGDAVIEKPALLRMFDVANLVIAQPHIELKGLRNADYVRDILRQGGQLEAQRTDKIRYR